MRNRSCSVVYCKAVTERNTRTSCRRAAYADPSWSPSISVGSTLAGCSKVASWCRPVGFESCRRERSALPWRISPDKSASVDQFASRSTVHVCGCRALTQVTAPHETPKSLALPTMAHPTPRLRTCLPSTVMGSKLCCLLRRDLPAEPPMRETAEQHLRRHRRIPSPVDTIRSRVIQPGILGPWMDCGRIPEQVTRPHKDLTGPQPVRRRWPEERAPE